MIKSTLTIDEAEATDWDCIVVGAGLAGTVAAIGLASRNVKTLLVDSKTFPRSKVCGACLNADAIAGLRALASSSKTKDHDFCVDTLFETGVPLTSYQLACGRNRLDLELPRGLSISRHLLDARLVQRAIDVGVSFLSGCRCQLKDDIQAADVAKTSGSASDHRRVVLVGRPRRSLSAKAVVIASGLATDVNLDSPEFSVNLTAKSRIGVAHLASRFPDHYEEGKIYMAVGSDGYAGLSRTENDTLNIAAAISPQAIRGGGGQEHAAKTSTGNNDASRGSAAVGPAEAVRRILLTADYPVTDEMLDGSWMGTVRMTRKREAVAGRRIFFCGDAAGYIEPFTGEGMAWAIRSGRAVSPIVARAVNQWQDSCIDEWTQVTNDLVRSQQSWCHRLARLLRYPMLVRGAMHLVGAVPAVGNYVVREINKERTHEVFDRGTWDRAAA